MAKVIIYPDRKRAVILPADGDDGAAIRSDAAALSGWLNDEARTFVLVIDSTNDVEVRHG